MADSITKPVTEQTDAEKKESYREWASKYYNQKYETWMPWMEDQYLKWFGKDNKASYATKGMLSSILQKFLLLRNRATLTDMLQTHSARQKSQASIKLTIFKTV
jgi:hypothetical protein